MNLIRGLVLTKEVYSTLKGFDGKLGKEETNSKKLSEDLKTMSLEKAQLESKKRFLQVKLDTVVAREAGLKAQHEVKLTAAKECLKEARDKKRAVKASQKRAEEAQKLVEERAFVVETAATTVNGTLDVIVAEKDSLLAEVKEKIERIKANRADAEARTVAAYQDGFEGTPEYKDLAHHFMTVGGKQLVERIAETHLEWDISFLRHPHTDNPHTVKPQVACEAQTLLPISRIAM
ncbi:hypothetical protein Adt_06956 [Abeliophyllum distichum]|uniref:Uncharacterized protein n=1 Tax=Abeliophyllum distichum TaxID=126358 RepID=A0ABD1V8E1_9LAMI